MEEIYKNLKKILLICIHDISDMEYQKRVWIRLEGPEVDCPNECFCNFFDDINVPSIIKDYKKYEFSRKQAKILKKFYLCLSTYSDESPITLDAREMHDDPRWHEVCRFAKEVYHKIR